LFITLSLYLPVIVPASPGWGCGFDADHIPTRRIFSMIFVIGWEINRLN
jgi:hypothetical protein